MEAKLAPALTTLLWLALLLTGCAAPAEAPAQVDAPSPGAIPTPSAAPSPIEQESTPDAAPSPNPPASRAIEHIYIPAIRVSSPVTEMRWSVTEDSPGGVWQSPDDMVGWAIGSALPDQPGNVLLYGHNNMYSAIFRDLGDLQNGDLITLQTGRGNWEYEVAQVEIVRVFGVSDEVLAGYAMYMQQTFAPRLTLISCWPPISNTHRVVVIAYPRRPAP
jgi:LPXTG-site transpeptidase (sortase) family protein